MIARAFSDNCGKFRAAALLTLSLAAALLVYRQRKQQQRINRARALAHNTTMQLKEVRQWQPNRASSEMSPRTSSTS